MATKIKYCPEHPTHKVYARNKCVACYSTWYQQRRRKRVTLLDPKKRSEARKTTDQRALLNLVYKILCVELKPIHRRCEANLLGCTHKANEIHHQKGRKGILLIMSSHFKYVCSSCHRWITDHSGPAKELGLSLPINSETDYIFTPREIELIKKYNIRTPKSVHIT